MSLVENTVSQMQDALELWDIYYDETDEKYIARTNSYVVLNADQIEWIKTLGLSIFSVQKFEHTLTIRFSSGGGH